MIEKYFIIFINTKRKMYGLNIHLISFKLNQCLFNETDKVRVSITTFPEQNKEKFLLEAKQMKCVHHFFTVNVTKKTSKILFVFRKKSFLQGDPIIASTIVCSKEIPNLQDSSNKYNEEVKTIKIFEPVQSGHKIRRVYGEMSVQFSLTTAFTSFENKQTRQNIKKNCDKPKYSKVNGYSMMNENQKNENSIFPFAKNDVYN